MANQRREPGGSVDRAPRPGELICWRLGALAAGAVSLVSRRPDERAWLRLWRALNRAPSLQLRDSERSRR